MNCDSDRHTSTVNDALPLFPCELQMQVSWSCISLFHALLIQQEIQFWWFIFIYINILHFTYKLTSWCIQWHHAQRGFTTFFLLLLSRPQQNLPAAEWEWLHQRQPHHSEGGAEELHPHSGKLHLTRMSSEVSLLCVVPAGNTLQVPLRKRMCDVCYWFFSSPRC